MRALPLTRVALVFIALLALCSVANAQTLYGSLTGNVTDTSGASVPNAKVEALNVGTGIAKQAVADERGAYLFSDLQPGNYKITISAPAFASRVQEGVILDANTVHRLDVSLAVSQISESVTVAANAVTLQTDRGDINNQIRSSEIADLPMINSQGSNFQVLHKLLPGFTPPGGGALGRRQPAEVDGDPGEWNAAVEQ
jgi:hypothetical protein